MWNVFELKTKRFQLLLNATRRVDWQYPTLFSNTQKREVWSIKNYITERTIPIKTFNIGKMYKRETSVAWKQESTYSNRNRERGKFDSLKFSSGIFIGTRRTSANDKSVTTGGIFILIINTNNCQRPESALLSRSYQHPRDHPGSS